MYSFIFLVLVRKIPKRYISESQERYFPISMGVGEGIVREFGMVMYTLLYLK